VLALDIVEANGQLSRYFGPDGGNLESDLFWTFWTTDEVVQSFFDHISDDLQELARGYAAGYNRYLRETGKGALPEACRDAEWVREIDEIDLFRVYYKLVDRAGASNLFDYMVAAVPPMTMAGKSPAEQAPPFWASLTPEQFREQANLPVWKPEDIGSNMVGLGGDVTENGRGMLLVNPHFPWTGPLRFYQVHVTIPGVIDSMGASLFGTPLPVIAFNRNVAWSHTVSAASRFVLRYLTLDSADPTSYVFDGETRSMTPHSVSVEVLEPDGTLSTREHTFYETQFGPVVAPFIPWNVAFALAVEDVSRNNFRIFDQILEENRARDLDEFVAALEGHVALPWVNTAAVDRNGGAFYGDIGTVPHVTDAKLAACSTPMSPLFAVYGLTLIDGSVSECKLGNDPDAPQSGIFGPGNLPSLWSREWVQNSNDSYWLTRPDTPLEGFSSLLGGERKQQGLRTRLGILQIEERLAGTDGLPGNRFDLAAVQNLVTANRNLSAELMLDAMLTLCDEEPNQVSTDEGLVDVGPACAVLAGWSRRMDTESIGALVWRVLWPRLRGITGLYAVPFDVDDPANTPRDMNLGDPIVRAGAMNALAEAVVFLGDNGLPFDAAWGDVHFDVRNGVRIPISGGPGDHGIYNAIGAELSPGEGYTPIGGGSSIVMAVSFGRWGPIAKGVLTYSQSTDPESPFFADQTLLFSEEGWNDLPFHPWDIHRAQISKIHIREKRPGADPLPWYCWWLPRHPACSTSP
jgi:acyl-homoserine-lactone acylase